MSRLTRGAACACLLYFALPAAADSVLSRDGIQSARLSPGGDRIAIHLRQESDDTVVIYNAESLAVEARHTVEAPRRIGTVRWPDNETVVLSLAEDRQHEPLPVATGNALSLTVQGETTAGPRGQVAAGGGPRLASVNVDESQFDDLLGSLYAGPAQSAISVVTTSADNQKLIVRTDFNNRQSEYSIVSVENGARRRILRKGSGLFFAGGTPEESYDQVAFSTAGSDPVSGFVAIRRAAAKRDYPTVVLLQQDPTDYAWDGSFDDEVDFFSRQRTTVLTLNSLDTTIATAAQQIRDAIDWAAGEGHTQDNRVCLVGRGAGGTLAVLASLQIKGVRCAVSLGGEPGGHDGLATMASEKTISNKSADVLLISGGDESSDYLDELNRFNESLHDSRVDSERMLVPGEKRRFAARENEARALAATALLVNDRFGKMRALAVLPMTSTQSRQLKEIFDEFNVMARTRATNEAIAWLDRRDSDVEAFLSPEQWDAYEAMIDQLGIKDRRSVGVPRQVPVSN